MSDAATQKAMEKFAPEIKRQLNNVTFHDANVLEFTNALFNVGNDLVKIDGGKISLAEGHQKRLHEVLRLGSKAIYPMRRTKDITGHHPVSAIRASGGPPGAMYGQAGIHTIYKYKAGMSGQAVSGHFLETGKTRLAFHVLQVLGYYIFTYKSYSYQTARDTVINHYRPLAYVVT